MDGFLPKWLVLMLEVWTYFPTNKAHENVTAAECEHGWGALLSLGICKCFAAVHLGWFMDWARRVYVNACKLLETTPATTAWWRR